MKNLSARVAIASGDDTSNYIGTGGAEIVGIYCPAALTGTTYSFMCFDRLGDTGVPINGLTVTHADGEFVPLTLAQIAMFLGANFIAVKSNATEGADRVITLARRVMVA